MSNNSQTKDTPSTLEVTTFLKEEGFYDPLLSNREMLELYQAVSNSKNTASAEDEKRILEESQQNADMIDELRLNSVPISRDDLSTMSCSFSSNASIDSKENSIDVIHKDGNHFDDIDVFNSVPTKHPPLARISYKPIYSPPLYCNPKIAHLPFEEKKKLIAAYHKKLIDVYDCYQRQSACFAPIGKPIQSDNRFNGSLLRTDSNYEFEDDKTYEQSQDDNSNDIYVLRSGRQTKRKLYSENSLSEKKLKPSETPVSVSKKKNKDDLNRSKIITEQSKNRSEKMFENLVEAQRKQEEQEKENELFLKSLQMEGDEEDDNKDEIETIQVEEPFIRRRVVPPLRGRGRSNKANNTKTKRNANKKPPLNDESLETITTFSSTSSQGDDYGTCPICNLRFPKDKLESHADQCIDQYEERNSPIGARNITCEKCDQVMLFNMDYELHVRDCLTKPSSVS